MFSSTEKGRGVKQGHTTHFPKHRGAPAPQDTLALAMPTPAAARASSSGGSAHLPCQAAQQRIAWMMDLRSHAKQAAQIAAAPESERGKMVILVPSKAAAAALLGTRITILPRSLSGAAAICAACLA